MRDHPYYRLYSLSSKRPKEFYNMNFQFPISLEVMLFFKIPSTNFCFLTFLAYKILL